MQGCCVRAKLEDPTWVDLVCLQEPRFDWLSQWCAHVQTETPFKPRKLGCLSDLDRKIYIFLGTLLAAILKGLCHNHSISNTEHLARTNKAFLSIRSLWFTLV